MENNESKQNRIKEKQRKLIMRVFWSVMYWSLATAIMILLDNRSDMISPEFSWFLGCVMMAVYIRLEFTEAKY